MMMLPYRMQEIKKKTDEELEEEEADRIVEEIKNNYY